MHLLCKLYLTVPIFRITRREQEAKETWRGLDEAGVEEFKRTTPLKDAAMGVKELIRDATHVTKV